MPLTGGILYYGAVAEAEGAMPVYGWRGFELQLVPLERGKTGTSPS